MKKEIDKIQPAKKKNSIQKNVLKYTCGRREI